MITNVQWVLIKFQFMVSSHHKITHSLQLICVALHWVMWMKYHERHGCIAGYLYGESTDMVSPGQMSYGHHTMDSSGFSLQIASNDCPPHKRDHYSWCHDMATLSAFLAICVGKPPTINLWIPFTDACIDGLVQERRNSIANALELRLSCTNPSMCMFLLASVS